MSATFKVQKTGNFTVISNYHLQDKSLSLKAKGLLTLMLSLDDLWKYSVRGLAGTSKDSVQSVTSGLRELEEHGYVERRQILSGGQFAGVQYLIYEIPPQEIDAYLEKTKETLLGGGCSKSEHPQIPASERVSQIRTLPQKSKAAQKPANASNTNGYSDSDEQDENSGVIGFPVTENPYTVEGVSGFPVTENPYTDNPYTENPSPIPYKKLNKIKYTSTDSLSINQSSTSTEEAAQPQMDGLMDTAEEEVYQQLADQVELEDWIAMEGHEEEMRETVRLAAEVIASSSYVPYYRINGANIPAKSVAARFRSLTGEQLVYTVNAFSNTTTRIRNPRAYMIAALYNAATTANLDMAARVSSDLAEEHQAATHQSEQGRGR